MAEFTVNNLLTRNQIESSTSATEGKVYFATDGGIYIGQPDHTTVLAETSHDNLVTTTQLASYLNKAGGEMTGSIINNNSAMWCKARDAAGIKLASPDENDNRYYPLLDIKTKAGDWSLGHISYDPYKPMDGLIFSYVPDTKYSTSDNYYLNYAYLIPREGTAKGGNGDQILTSYDISNRQNLDGRYTSYSYADSRYLKFGGGEMTGPISNNNGGGWATARDKAAVRLNNPDESINKYYATVGVKTSYGDWTIGHISKDNFSLGDALIFSYITDTHYVNGYNYDRNYAYLSAREVSGGAVGDQILTSYDISNRQNLDGRYIHSNTYISDIWVGTQVQYSSIVTKDPKTFYIITS